MLHFLHNPLFLLKPKTHLSSHSALLHLKHLHSLHHNSSCLNFTDLSNLLKGHISQPHLLQIHAQVFILGAHQDNLIATRLIGHYPSQFSLRLFHQLQAPNIFPFNAIIRLLAEEGLFSSAFLIFRSLKLQSLSPNDLTFSFLFKACFRTSDANYVKQIHTHVVKLAFVDDPVVCNGLLVVYAKGFKDLVSAHKLFVDMPERDMVCCWTSLISGYAKLGQSEDVLQLFLAMVQDNLRPDDDTMVNVLSASSNLDIVDIEKWVRRLAEFEEHCVPKRLGLDSVKIVLVYFYGKWGKMDHAREIFNEISANGKRSVLSWNAMVGAYVQNACTLEALSLFRLMEEYNCRPNHVTMVSVLSACAQIGDLDLGMRIHDFMKSEGWKSRLAFNRNLGTALIDMYSKCGSLDRAREVFNGMATKDVISFNAMIMGLAINGEGKEAMCIFPEMQKLCLLPNAGTFLGVLCACSHSGLLEEGRQVFADMSHQFLIYPKLEHYACYVDLLSRSGCIEEAVEVVASMPYEPNAFVWGSLLGGCVLHNKLEYAQDVSRMLVKVDPENSAGYVMLSNALAGDRRWKDVSGLRCLMKDNGAKKQAGQSWISIEGTVYEFLAGSSIHPQIGRLDDILDRLLKEMKLGSPLWHFEPIAKRNEARKSLAEI